MFNTKVNVIESDLHKAKNDTDTAIHLAKEAQTMASSTKPSYANVGKGPNKNVLAGRRNSFNNNNNNKDNRRDSSNNGHRGSSLATAGSSTQGVKPTTRLGAPPRSRYLVIGRVLKDKTVDDIKSYINDIDSNVEIRGLEPISHADAPFQKFKLEVSVSDFFKVKDRDFWESGISCYPFRGQWYRDPTNNADE